MALKINVVISSKRPNDAPAREQSAGMSSRVQINAGPVGCSRDERQTQIKSAAAMDRRCRLYPTNDCIKSPAIGRVLQDPVRCQFVKFRRGRQGAKPQSRVQYHVRALL